MFMELTRQFFKFSIERKNCEGMEPIYGLASLLPM